MSFCLGACESFCYLIFAINVSESKGRQTKFILWYRNRAQWRGAWMLSLCPGTRRYQLRWTRLKVYLVGVMQPTVLGMPCCWERVDSPKCCWMVGVDSDWAQWTGSRYTCWHVESLLVADAAVMCGYGQPGRVVWYIVYLPWTWIGLQMAVARVNQRLPRDGYRKNGVWKVVSLLNWAFLRQALLSTRSGGALTCAWLWVSTAH